MKTRSYDKGAYIYRIDSKHILKFLWNEEKNTIYIIWKYNNGYISTFAERSYRKSTLAEMRTVFEYLVDYYRSYRER